VANVALAAHAGNLSASTDESTWVLTSYLVSNAIMLPAAGWIARRIGRKRLFDAFYRRVYRGFAALRHGV